MSPVHQHGILPWFLWPLLVYDVPVTTVEAGEENQEIPLQVIWLTTQPEQCSFIWEENVLQLPFDSVMEGFKVSSIRETLQYAKSKDPKVSVAYQQEMEYH